MPTSCASTRMTPGSGSSRRTLSAKAVAANVWPELGFKFVHVGCSMSRLHMLMFVTQQSVQVCVRRTLTVKAMPANFWRNKGFKFVHVCRSLSRLRLQMSMDAQCQGYACQCLTQKRFKFVYVGRPMSRLRLPVLRIHAEGQRQTLQTTIEERATKHIQPRHQGQCRTPNTPGPTPMHCV